MKIADYIMNFIADLGVEDVFCVTGGGAMHMNNALGQSDRLNGVFMLHEQGAAIAAEAYARVRDGYGCCLVTSGPGATNALTGLVGAYIDSIPVIFISGQAKRADLVGDQGIRQFGIQEVDIISMVGSYTKYAVQVKEPEDIRYELEKASALAVNGRPGPVWIDVPLDIQATDLDVDALRGFDASKLDKYEVDEADVVETIRLLNESKKPVIMLGHGIRLSHSVDLAREIYDSLGIPVLTSWNGVDLIEADHQMYFGRPGMVGQRAANLIQQGADFVLTLGTRLCILNTGYNYESFLSRAKHVMVDIDVNELKKKSVNPTLAIAADVARFLRVFKAHMGEVESVDRSEWIDKCKTLTEKYPVRIKEQEPRDGFVSTYDVVQAVSDKLMSDDIYQFTSSGTSVDIAMKTLQIKWGQRAFLTKGLASMGYDIPASVGSCVGSKGRRVACITGDGSFAMNMQELEVIKRLNLPVKLFVIDNSGYSMIYQSQNNNFKGRLTGCVKDSGLTLPDMTRVADAIGIKSMKVEITSELNTRVSEAFDYDGPVVCVVKTDITQLIVPKQVSYMREDGQMASRPLEDMGPLLDRDELEWCLGE